MTTETATQAPSAADQIRGALEVLRAEWPRLSTNPRMKFDAEVEWIVQTCFKSEEATATALGNLGALQAALANAAGVGVSLDPARKLAYVLPRDKRMVYDLSYMGLIDIAMSTGAILWAQAHIVYESEAPDFVLMGYDHPPVHKRNPWLKAEDRGAPVGAYVVVKTATGDYLTSTMTFEEIEAIRARSKSRNGPWKTDWVEMAKKTVVKSASKYWPRAPHDEGRLEQAIHYLNTEGDQGIDLTPEDASRTRLLEWRAKLQATTTDEAAAALYKQARADFAAAEDSDGYDAFRDEVVAHRTKLKNPKPAGQANPAPGAGSPPPPASAQGRQPMSDKPLSYAQIVDLIKAAETDEELDATNPHIDRLPVDQQSEIVPLYNDRLEYLNEKFGAAP